MQQHSNLRIVIDKRNLHPYAVRHRLQFFARQAQRYLTVQEDTKTQTILQVHIERN